MDALSRTLPADEGPCCRRASTLLVDLTASSAVNFPNGCRSHQAVNVMSLSYSNGRSGSTPAMPSKAVSCDPSVPLLVQALTPDTGDYAASAVIIILTSYYRPSLAPHAIDVRSCSSQEVQYVALWERLNCPSLTPWKRSSVPGDTAHASTSKSKIACSSKHLPLRSPGGFWRFAGQLKL